MKIVLFFLLMLSVSLSADKIILVADEWCPYNCKLSANKQGYIVEIAYVIFEKAGHTVEYVGDTSWHDAIINTRGGVFSGIIGAYKTDAPDFIFPNEPVGFSEDSFLLKTNNPWTYQGIDSLETLTIGHIQGYSYGKKMDAYIKENINNKERIQLVSGDRAIVYNAKKLLYETVDVLIEDINVLNYYFHDDIEHGVFRIEEGLEILPIYIAFSPANKKSKNYAKVLSDGIIELRKNGELQKILSRYGLKDWAKDK